MAEYEKQVRKILLQNGCHFVRHGKGDHDIYYSPITKRNFTVDSKIKSRHTANAIMKQSGIEYHF
ncbi:MAG: type II toxin-antitoxin system HicA family toxin [Spirochaetaceae bacterium]|jgi:predicted RNA binding protein YcfA (HicA-like mRNA interferase family)|nr:type II toxin-antitoxin system HicA family toxin [Spirochaetaceae bacterium]MBO5731523.1 type II toxin-antitoxin system HicA family toxin [Treponema sp.]